MGPNDIAIDALRTDVRRLTEQLQAEVSSRISDAYRLQESLDIQADEMRDLERRLEELDPRPA